MHIAVLQFELLIPGAESLKDKRRVVRSVKDRLHREHQVSVAEIDNTENPGLAVLALAAVGAESKHLAQVTDRILAKLRQLPDAELGEFRRDILSTTDIETEDPLLGEGRDLPIAGLTEPGGVWAPSEWLDLDPNPDPNSGPGSDPSS